MRPRVAIVPFIQTAPFREPKDRIDISALSDWSLGGINLSDGTQGMEIQDWNYTVEGVGAGTGIYLTSGTYPHTLQISAPNITWVRGSFDQNMHPAVVYISGSSVILWWWDPTIPAQVFRTLDPSYISPSIVMDDTRDRESLLGNNDLVLAYIKGTSLYYRLERDRYNVEYTWDTDIPSLIIHPFINRMGMDTKWRFQLEIQEDPAFQ